MNVLEDKWEEYFCKLNTARNIPANRLKFLRALYYSGATAVLIALEEGTDLNVLRYIVGEEMRDIVNYTSISKKDV